MSVNEECEDANRTPGPRGRALDVHPRRDLRGLRDRGAGGEGCRSSSPNSPDDVLATTGKIVFGTPGLGTVCVKLLIIAVLSSAAASCQTTILPAARTALSMAVHRAFPPKFGEVHPRHLTPAFSTWLFGIVSSIWYAGLVIVSRITRRQRARLVGAQRRPDDRLLLRPDRHRVRHLLPPLPVQEREELLLRRTAAVDRRHLARRAVPEVGLGHDEPRLHRRGHLVARASARCCGSASACSSAASRSCSGGTRRTARSSASKRDPIDDAPAARRWRAAPAARSAKEHPADGRRNRSRLRRRARLARRAADRGRDRGGVQAAARDRVRIRAAADGWRTCSTSSKSVEELGEQDHRRGGAARARASTRRSRSKVELVNDRPAEAILRAADQYDALAIVVGAAGRGPIAGALLGSVTYQVVHRSTRPVVVVPSPESRLISRTRSSRG